MYDVPPSLIAQAEMDSVSLLAFFINTELVGFGFRQIGPNFMKRLAQKNLINDIEYPSFDEMYRDKDKYREFHSYLGLVCLRLRSKAILDGKHFVNSILKFEFPAEYSEIGRQKYEAKRKKFLGADYK